MDILIIGTNPVERSWFEEQTYLFGHEVTACATGKAALEHCQHTFFPLIIITDSELSDMRVEEFCHRIRTLPREAHSIVLVVVEQEKIRNIQTLIDVGVDDYLLRPIEKTQFRLRLAILERRIKHEQAMEILRTAQTYAGNILESSLDMIIAVDMKRHIMEFNRAAQETFGYRLEEVLGKHVDMLYADTAEAANVSKTTLQQGRCVREILNRRRNGEVFPCLLAASILCDIYGKPIGIMGISRDITHRKHAEEELKQTHAELARQNVALARASKLKDEFLSLISHELRTPLTVILSQAELLHEQMYGILNETQQSAVESIETSGHRLLGLINDIIDFSKINQGRLEIKLTSIPVEPLCQTSLQLVFQQAQEKQLKLSSMLDKNVMTIKADERLLKQVLSHLLHNAVKFTPKGGEVGLEVQGHPEQGVMHFVVWDTGIGIAEEDIDRLFQPFVQLDAGLSREYVGAGLGLAMVCHIVNIHGGNIAVKSKLGQGSRFTVTLPWNPQAKIHPPSESEPSYLSQRRCEEECKHEK